MNTREPLWRRYLRFVRPNPAADVDDEVRFHLDELIRQFRAAGMDAAAAERAAMQQFGDVHGVRRAMTDQLARRVRRDARAAWWRRMAFDARVAARNTLRQPGLTAAAVVTLALGIGANTAVFSVVNAALLRALPYPAADSIVRVDEVVRGNPFPFSVANFVDFRSQTHSFTGLAAINAYPRTLTEAGDPLPLSMASVTDDFFDIMRVRPEIGRTFTSAEHVAGQNHVVVLSSSLWRETFGARRDIVGRNIQLDAKSYQVIGVMPENFEYPSGVKAWTPIAFAPDALSDGQRGGHFLDVVGRLKPGVSLESSARDIAALAARLASAYPQTNKGNGAVIRTLRDDLVGPSMRRALYILLGAVALVALIASANVANLLLARGASRNREFAVRTALGARASDLIGLALVESLILAIIGGAVGTAVAWAGTRALDALRPPDLQSLGSASVDGTVLGFALGLSVLSGLLFGLGPAFQAARASNVHGTLKAGGRGQMIGRGGWQLRGALVATELALAVILLAGSALLLRSFDRLEHVDVGFDSHNVLTYRLSLPDARYPKAEQSELLYQQLLDRTRGLPGVVAAGAISGLPLEGFINSVSTYSVDALVFESAAQPHTQIRFATPGALSALRIPLVAGRDFTAADRSGAPDVVLINQSAAKLFFGDRNPLGHTLKVTMTFDSLRGRVGGEIVGVMKDVRDDSPGTPPRPAIFASHAQFPAEDMAITVRVADGADPLALVTPIRAQLRELDAALPMSAVRTMDNVSRTSVAQTRFATQLLACFALIALSLAAVGVFGVMTFMVGQRTREIGVRMALGASRSAVVGQTMRRALIPVGSGVALGLIGAIALGRTMTSLLFDVQPGDPVILATVAAVLSAVALAAAWLPSRRASRVDPVVALQAE